MANELQFASGVTGQTVEARLILAGSVVSTGNTVAEVSSQGGFYQRDMPTGQAPGLYTVIFLVGGALKGAGSILWDGNREVTFADLGLYPPNLQMH